MADSAQGTRPRGGAGELRWSTPSQAEENSDCRSADLQIGCSGDVHIPAFRTLRNGSASCSSVDLEVHATAERELGATKFAREAIMGAVGQVLTGSESRSLVGLNPSS